MKEEGLKVGRKGEGARRGKRRVGNGGEEESYREGRRSKMEGEAGERREKSRR